MKHILSTVCIAFLSSACAEPFPNMTGLSDSFHEKREQVAALEAMLDGSIYDIVDMHGDTIIGHWIEGVPVEGQAYEQEQPENADRWAEPLRELGVMSIERTEIDELWLDIDVEFTGREFEGSASYVSSQNIHLEFRQCERSFANARCGQCLVGLEDDWWLVYKWSPLNLVDELFDDWQEGRMTEEEFFEAQSDVLYECVVDGGTFLGESGLR